MLDDAAVFLCAAGHKTGHIDQCDNRDIERITKTHEAGAFDRRPNIQTAGQHQRLVGNNPHRAALHTPKPDHQIASVVRL